MGIKPAFVSRVSNEAVHLKAKHRAASEILRKRRLMLVGRVLRSPPNHPIRTCCFLPNTLYPLNDFYVRRVGRPSKEWMKQVMPDICTMFRSLEEASAHTVDKNHWKRVVSEKLGF